MKKKLLMTAIAIFGLTTITMAQVPSYVPTSGLVGWWPFNGNANDESGNGNNGTVSGATLTSDRFTNSNSAYSFDGISNFIDCNITNLPISNQARSFSCWFYAYDISNSSTQQKVILNYGPILSNQRNCLMHWGTGVSFIAQANDACWGCTGSTNYYNPSTTVDNTWHNFIITYQNDTLKGYLDGQLSFTAPKVFATSLTSMKIGYGVSSHWNGEPFFGNLDDIGIWDRALTQQEISDLYNGCQLAVNTQPTNQTININSNAEFVVSSSDPSATCQWQTDLGVGFQNLNSVGQYSGTTNDTLTVSNVTMSNNNQPFRCIITSGSCSDTSNVAVLTVNNNVGINETMQDKLFSVFPNPAQSVINVKADGKLIGSVYSIYDNTGRVVLSGKLNAEITTIELGNLSGGIYMFSIGENMKQTFKVIKE